MKPILSAILALCVAIIPMMGADIDPADLTIDENISRPVVPKKAGEAIRKHMANLSESFKKHGLDASTGRNGEIIEITIPCSSLFAANSGKMYESSARMLQPLVSILKYPTMYKVIIAVHSDDTGEAAYLDTLTATRANALDDYLCDISGTEGSNIIPYGMGSDDPLFDNESVANRAANRRVEVYIVPEWQMIDAAKSGRLK